MADPTRNPPPPADPEPGHYGAGYGEQVPEEAPPQLGPGDGDPPPRTRDDAAGGAVHGEAATSTEGDDGEAVVVTPADVDARPSDRPPGDAAPECEKAALVFERS